MNDEVKKYMQEIGRKGGKSKSQKKHESSQRNVKKALLARLKKDYDKKTEAERLIELLKDNKNGL